LTADFREVRTMATKLTLSNGSTFIIKDTQLFINGEFVDSLSGKTFPVVNPATEEVICTVQEALEEDVDRAVNAAVDAFEKTWRHTNGTDRRDLMNRLVDLIEKNKEELATLETLNNGKPRFQSAGYGSETDLYLTIKCLRYFAGWADKIEGKVIPVEGNNFCYSVREPIGAVGQILPWNFPLLMLAWKLGPALAAGCTIVLKTSEKTPLSALYVARLINEAGFPPGVVNIVSGYGPTAGQAIARHMKLTKVAFTGSTPVGRLMVKYASESNLKRVTLELGGKSPLIILEDADLDKACAIAEVGLFLNQGQCCAASSRLFVQEAVYDRFVELAAERARKRVLGDPYDPKTQQGPQVDDIQYKRVMGYIDQGKQEGARLVAGGARFGDRGYFIAPTVFADVTDEMKIAKEEIFGPVMSILKFSTVDEAIRRANQSSYGHAA